jgi:small-conductance mechanosensitive channel
MTFLNQIGINPMIIAVGIVIVCIALGYALEWIVLRQAAKIAMKTKWELDNLLVASLKSMIFPWFVVGGVYLAARPLSLSSGQQAMLDKSLQVIIVVVITALVARIAVVLVKYLSKDAGGALPSATLFSNITRLVVFAGGSLMLLQTLGISITPMLTALGVGGLAVALALQDTLGNLFAGIQILATHNIRPGDYISLDSGQEGYVADITWRNTTIRTLPNTLIIVPNSKIASVLVTNYHLPDKQMAVLVQVGVAYGSDLKKVEHVTIDVGREVMKTVTGGVPDFEPFIRYHTFGEYSVNFSVILRGKEFVDQYLIKHEFIQRLHDRYHRESIEIPFPVRTINISTASEHRKPSENPGIRENMS